MQEVGITRRHLKNIERDVGNGDHVVLDLLSVFGQKTPAIRVPFSSEILCDYNWMAIKNGIPSTLL